MLKIYIQKRLNLAKNWVNSESRSSIFAPETTYHMATIDHGKEKYIKSKISLLCLRKTAQNPSFAIPVR